MKKNFTIRTLFLSFFSWILFVGIAGAQTAIPSGSFPGAAPLCPISGTVGWDNSVLTAGNQVVVFIKPTTAITIGTPTSNVGSTYNSPITDLSSPGTSYENDAAAKLIYHGSGNSVAVIGLTPGTTYRLLIFNTNNATTYSAPLLFSGATISAPDDATSLTATRGNNQATVSWTNTVTTCMDAVLIVAKEGSAVTATPSGDGSAYTGNLAFGSGTPIVAGAEYVVYKGSTSPKIVTSLINGKTYFFKVFTKSGTSWSAGVETSVALAPDNVSTFTSTAGNGQMVLKWGSPNGTCPTCFDEVMIVAKENTLVTATPTGDGTSPLYQANLAFSQAPSTQIVTNEWVVYKGPVSGGSGAGITVTNLANCLPANFTAFTRKGTLWSSGNPESNTPTAPLAVSTLFPAIGATAATNTKLILTFPAGTAVTPSTTGGGSPGDPDRGITVKQNGTTLSVIDRNSGSITISSGNQVTVVIPALTLSTTATPINVSVEIGDRVFTACGSDFSGIAAGDWSFVVSKGVTLNNPSIGVCQSVYSALGDITVTETAVNNIQGVSSSSRTLILKFDATGFAFKASGITASVAAGGDVASVNPINSSFSTSTLTFNFPPGGAQDDMDVITIQGLQVISDGSNPSAHIVMDGASTLGLQGVTAGTTRFATITNGPSSTAPAGHTFTPAAGNGKYCAGTNLSAITVSVVEPVVTWYSDAELTNIVSSANPANLQNDLGLDTNTPGTTIFYVAQTAGCKSPGHAVPITIYPTPSADAGTFAATQCSGNIVTMAGGITLGASPTVSVPSSPPYTYTWTELTGNYTGGAIPSVANPNVVIDNTSGTTKNYQFKVVISDVNSCSGTSTANLDVFTKGAPQLTQPSATTFTTKSDPVTLASNYTTTNFYGVGVIQTNAVTYKFDPQQAYDPGQGLPQTYHIFFNGTDPNGCAIHDFDIAIMTLSDNNFTNLQSQYCAEEKPGGGSLPGGAVDLSLSPAGLGDLQASATRWNSSTRFGNVGYTIPNWLPLVVYSKSDLVYYGGEIFRSLSDGNISLFFTPAAWTAGAFQVSFKGTVYNWAEGYYGGNTNPNDSTVVHAAGKAWMYTNPDYVGFPGYNVIYPSGYLDFEYYGDIKYYLGWDWNSASSYKVGEIVFTPSVAGVPKAYKCIFTNTNVFPVGNPAYWDDLNDGSHGNGFQKGYYYFDPLHHRAGFLALSQYVQINKKPPIGFTGLSDGQTICQGDVSGATLSYDLTSSLNAAAPTNAGTFEVSFDGTTWVKDGPSGNSIVNNGINTGLATFDTQNAWTKINALVTGPAFAWNSTTYKRGDNVLAGGISYVSLVDGNSGHAPASSPTYWQANSLGIGLRLLFDPGTHGSAGQTCFSDAPIKIFLRKTPSILFDPSIVPALKCNYDSLVHFRTVQTTGVVFSGFGVGPDGIDTGKGTLDPNSAFTLAGGGTSDQNIVITATITDDKGCQNKTTNNSFSVKPPVPASFSISHTSIGTLNYSNLTPAGSSVDFCYVITPSDATIHGNDSGSTFTVEYMINNLPDSIGQFGSSSTAVNNVTFNPTTSLDALVHLGLPVNTVGVFNLTYKNYSGACFTKLSPVTIKVAPALKPTIAGVADQEVFCSNEGVKKLTFSDFSSVVSFSINGVSKILTTNEYDYDLKSDAVLNQPKSNVLLSYNVPSASGCPNTVNKTIHVLASPKADFFINPRCDNDLIQYHGDDLSGNTTFATTFIWKLADTTPLDTVAQNPAHRFHKGNYAVSLNEVYDSVTVATGPSTSVTKACSSALSLVQVVGPIPNVDFTYSHVCEKDSTHFVTSQTDGVTKYKWYFGDDNDSTAFGAAVAAVVGVDSTMGTYQNPIHIYLPGTNTVMVTGKTDSLAGGCTNFKTRIVSSLKAQEIEPVTPYVMAAGTNGDWVVEDNSVNTNWRYATASPDGTVPKLQNAWTNIPYNPSDQSYVNSPCFDMSLYTKPAISFQYFMDGRQQQDGAVLQYSTDVVGGVQVWIPLGSSGSGLNWYNTQGISGKPGDPYNSNFLGWSHVADQDWQVAKHSLDVIPQAKRGKVRFRLAFGSDQGSTNGAQGFAFNDMRIIERNRLSLIENFTNDNLSAATTNNAAFQAFQPLNPEIVKLEYHVALPSPDAINAVNPVDPNARAAFYGLTNSASLIPRGYLDGDSQGDFTTGWLTNAFTLRSLAVSPMTIDIQSSGSSVTATATATEPITSGKLRFYVVAVEEVVDADKFVVRKIFPSAAGMPVPLPMAANSTMDLTAQWELDKALLINVTKIGIVAFVQDLETHDVLQARYIPSTSSIPPVLITAIDSPELDRFSTYPVPANKELRIDLSTPAQEPISINLVDQLGHVLVEGAFATGEQSKTIGTQQLSDGLYILQVGNNGSMARRKIIVVH